MKILVAVTGGISAYKAADLIIGLQKNNDEVRVVMTDNAKQFITPMTLATLSKHPVMNDMWIERDNVEHIEAGAWASAFIVYPATANIISKFANGIADDTLSTIYLGLPEDARGRTFVYPAMNTNMLEHPATVRNMETLRGDGVHIAETRVSTLACGDKGAGALLKPRDAVRWFLDEVVL